MGPRFLIFKTKCLIYKKYGRCLFVTHQKNKGEMFDKPASWRFFAP